MWNDRLLCLWIFICIKLKFTYFFWLRRLLAVAQRNHNNNRLNAQTKWFGIKCKVEYVSSKYTKSWIILLDNFFFYFFFIVIHRCEQVMECAREEAPANKCKWIRREYINFELYSVHQQLSSVIITCYCCRMEKILQNVYFVVFLSLSLSNNIFMMFIARIIILIVVVVNLCHFSVITLMRADQGAHAILIYLHKNSFVFWRGWTRFHTVARSHYSHIKKRYACRVIHIK